MVFFNSATYSVFFTLQPTVGFNSATYSGFFNSAIYSGFLTLQPTVGFWICFRKCLELS